MFRDIDVDNFIIDSLSVVKDGIQRAHEAHDFWGLHPELEMQMTYYEDAMGGIVKVFIDIEKIIMTTNVVIFLF